MKTNIAQLSKQRKKYISNEVEKRRQELKKQGKILTRKEQGKVIKKAKEEAKKRYK